MLREERALGVEALRWRCDPGTLGFTTTAELDSDFYIIGQQRAIDAIKLSLSVNGPGYNVYVAGISGSGRLTALRRMLEQLDLSAPALKDTCYVHNFVESDRPTLLRLPAGQGCALRQDMQMLVSMLRGHLSETFEGDEFQAKRKAIAQEGGTRAAGLFKEFEAELKEHEFQVVRLQMGPLVRPDVVPVVEGEPVIFEQLEADVQKGTRTVPDLDAMRKKHDAYHEQLETILKESTVIERETAEALTALEQDYAKWAVNPMIATLLDRYTTPEVHAYLNAVRDNVLNELDRFRKDGSEQSEGMPFAVEDEFVEYQVNVLVDNRQATRVPIIVDTAPTHQNLFGTIEAAVERFGRMSTNHTKIHAGSLVRADGGYIVFNLLDAITEPGVWKTLKRTLLSGQLDVRNEPTQSAISLFGMKPEPIPLDVKICVIGTRDLYHLLYQWDEDFHRVFKIKADFDYEMENTEERVRDVAQFVARLAKEERLLPWDASGVAALVEEGARRSGRKRKLTARLGRMADLVRESHYHAQQAGATVVGREHVLMTIAQKVQRTNLIEDKIRESIDEGTVLIDTAGAVVGQLNGLAVYSLGDYHFGKPARITAKVGIGQSGIINVEREAKLSGATHDKGILILQGYLRATYAQDRPITLSASLCFEQSYGGVDGDSASSTELYALLSALTGLPVDQGIAVTGSINQHGQVQAIGGVNEKIEGFFELCRDRGLTGTQGVMIPQSNVGDLMLRQDVLDAVAAGQFHVWAIAHVDEGLEILLGMPAGTLDAEGHFPEDSVHGRVDAALEHMGEVLKNYDHPPDEAGEDEGEHEHEHEDDEGDAGESEDDAPDPTHDPVPAEDAPDPDADPDDEDEDLDEDVELAKE